MKKFSVLLTLCAVGFVSVYAQERQAQDDTAKPAEGFTLKTAETIAFTTDEVTWMQVDVSPDGRTILFDLLGDLYTMPIAGGEARRIMGDLSFESQPTWSPDGKTIAFASDRGPQTDFENLKFSRWQVSLYSLETGRVTVVPDQAGQNLNPMWAPDGKSVAFVSDRTGIPNIFIYDFDKKDHYQITNVVGAVLAVTEYSPVITWAREADRLAFGYFENGDYSVWSVNNPRRLMKDPYRDSTARRQVVAQGTRPDSNAAPGVVQPASPTPIPALPTTTPPTTPARTDSSIFDGRVLANRDSVPHDISVYRGSTGVRPSATLPTTADRAEPVLSVAQLLDSAAITLPDTSSFRKYGYRVGFQPEYISRPSIGYAQDNFGRGVFGGTTIVLSDLLGDHRLAFAGQVNGRLSEAYLLAAYTSMGKRTQYTVGGLQAPTWYLTADGYDEMGQGIVQQTQAITRFITRQAFAIGAYPLNRFTRVEFGGSLNSVDRQTWWYSRLIDTEQGLIEYFDRPDSIVNRLGITYGAPYLANVSDHTLFGYTGPIAGRR